MSNTRRLARTASHRPAVRKRLYQHDTLTALDLFSGFGGLTQGIVRAGFDVITAANHNAYKVEVHEANHPTTEHWIADLSDPESADYHDVRDLPAADFLGAGVSCVNHSPANTMKAYETRGTLFDVEDEDYDERVTRNTVRPRGARSATPSSKPFRRGRQASRRPGPSAMASSTSTGAGHAAGPSYRRSRLRLTPSTWPTSGPASAIGRGRSQRRRWRGPSGAVSGLPSSPQY
jgi:hypothetical protein